MWWLTYFGSIREFCSLEMPIIMFDKNEDYAILTLEQVCIVLPAWFTSNDANELCRFCPCHLGRRLCRRLLLLAHERFCWRLGNTGRGVDEVHECE